jgi:ankyrin repeat protein
MWECWKYGRARFASFHLEDFDQILARGVLIDDEDDESRTLLSYLAEDGNTEAVKLAVECGADVNRTDIYDLTALDYATFRNRHGTAATLRKLGGIHGTGFSETEDID